MENPERGENAPAGVTKPRRRLAPTISMCTWGDMQVKLRVWRCLLTFLLELLDGTLVDTSALVDQVTGGGRLAGVDVADDHDVDVSLVL